MKHSKTEWYSGYVQPFRKGWYERDYKYADKCSAGTARIQMCYWTGMEWSAGQGEAYSIPYFASSEQHLPWRGVVK